MARIDDLIASVTDANTRAGLMNEVSKLRDATPLGLVFERHQPETVLLASDVGLRVGNVVRKRSAPGRDWTVTASTGETATIADGDEIEDLPVAELLVVQGFGQPIYPALTSLGTVEGSEDRPFNAIINGENFHALQALRHSIAGRVDCIYIDPPYNTGARDWKYNNDYVDLADRWRHSKWLSFIEKRLRLAKDLLKRDGVLVITIDENEVHHLGVLIEAVLPHARVQMVSICINPSGVSGAVGLSRVDEYAFFCFLGDAEAVPTPDDMLISGGDVDLGKAGAAGVRWEWMLRGGGSWHRATRPNLCYPVLLNAARDRIIGAGEPYSGPEDKLPATVNGHPAAWPIRTDGRLGIWRVDAARLRWLAEEGYAFVSNFNADRGTYTFKYLLTGTIEAIDSGQITVTGTGERGEVLVSLAESKGRTAKTMWNRGRHTAGGSGGTQMLTQLLGSGTHFTYPKSLYAVEDCLRVAIGDRKDALIVDFFAGSGTTLHATARLNAADEGHRRCILVTNNEVDEQQTKKLNKVGCFRGDTDFEAHGIFESVTRPRVVAALTGMRADGTPVPGNYTGGGPIAAGLSENCEFFRLDYLDPDDVELGRRFTAIHPLLWLAAGSRAKRNDAPSPADPFHLDPDSGYAVLFDETRLLDLIPELKDAEEVRDIFLVTDSEDAFAEMSGLLGSKYQTRMLYRDYLRSFRVIAGDLA